MKLLLSRFYIKSYASFISPTGLLDLMAMSSSIELIMIGLYALLFVDLRGDCEYLSYGGDYSVLIAPL